MSATRILFFLLTLALAVSVAATEPDPATTSNDLAIDQDLSITTTDTTGTGTDISPSERISGIWALNEKRSESFDKLAPQGRPSGDSGGGPGGGGPGGGMGGGPGGGMGGGRGGGMGGGMGGGRGGGMGGGPGGGMGGGPGGEDKDSTENRNMDPQTHMKKKFERLEIYIDGLELNVTDGLDITHLLYTDARQVTIWTERGEAKAQALWSGDELEVRWQARNGDTARIRNYIPSEDGQTLTVIDRLRQPGSEEFASLQMVYDRTK